MKNSIRCILCVFLIMAVAGPSGAAVAKEKTDTWRPGLGDKELMAYFAQSALQPEYVYYIQPGDLLAIRWIDGPELSGEAMQCEVSAEGRIKFPYLEDVFVAGLRPEELGRGLELKMKKYYSTPQFFVVVAKKAERAYVSGTYDIFGEVNRPGKYRMADDLSVLDAVLSAGGFTEFAKKNGVQVIRGEGKEKKKIKVKVGKLMKTGNKTLDVPLKEGDVIVVPESWF